MFMRTMTVFGIALAIMLQVGCASFPRMMAKKSKQSDPKITQKYLAARQFESQGQNERARQAYQELLAKKPNHPEYLHRMAVVCARLQRYGEANNLYERARRLDPENASLLTDMGYTAHLSGKQTAAERLLRDALKVKPNDVRATSNLALVVGVQGRTKESLTLLRKIEDESTALAAVAYIHYLRGETEMAEQLYRESLNLNPNLREAQTALAALVRQHSHPNAAVVHLVATEEENFESDDFKSSETLDDSKIQLVAATSDSDQDGVMTVGYTEETDVVDEPARLSNDAASVGRMTLDDESSPATADDDSDWQSPDESPAADEAATTDDWSDNSSAMSAQPRSKNSDWNSDADPVDEEAKSTNIQSTMSTASPDNALKFKPRKPVRSIAAQMMELDPEYAAPSSCKNRATDDE